MGVGGGAGTNQTSALPPTPDQKIRIYKNKEVYQILIITIKSMLKAYSSILNTLGRSVKIS
jgi:hypothetical protein